ncbi:hypothetical protein DMENIID0001_041630 [Sergentomyia squamirostris]
MGEAQDGSSSLGGVKATGGGDDDMNETQISNFRLRKYGEDASGPFLVYMHAKKKHSFNSVKISNALFKKYATIVKAEPVNRDKLRIEFDNKNDANALPLDEDFCLEHYVYVPSVLSEVNGKIFMNEEEDISLISSTGHGKLWGSTDGKMKILEVTRLKKKVKEGNQDKIVATPFVRITFEGTVLPDYILVSDKFRIPVKPYAPKIMKCSTCLNVGHTEKHCCYDKRCTKCGEIHRNTSEIEECRKTSFRCPNCKNSIDMLNISVP